MSWPLARAVLRLQARTIAVYAIGCFAYSLMVMVLFQRVVVPHPGFFRQYLNPFPRSLPRLFNAAPDASTLGGFVGADYLSVLWVVIIAAFVIAFTSGALAHELEDGTLELLLAYPIGRVQLLLTKAAALVAALLLIVGATALGLWLGAVSQGVEAAPGAFLSVGALALAFALAIAGYGFLCSAFSSERVIAAGAATVMTVLFYGLYVAAQSWDLLSGVRRFTIFNYFSPPQALDLGRLDLNAVAVLLAVALAGVVLAGLTFRMRDLAT